LTILREAKAKTGMKFARLALSEEKAFIFETEITVPEGGGHREAIEFILEENVPISPADAIFDYALVPEENQNGKEKVVVSVFPYALVESYISLFKQVGVTLLGVEMESEAAAAAAINKNDTGTHALLLLSGEWSTIAIVRRGVVRFSSTINSLPENGAGDLSLKENMEGSVQSLNLEEELRKIFSYWHDTHKEKEARVSSIVVCGDLAGRSSLPTYLSDRTGIETRLGNVWENVFSLDNYVPEISATDSLRFAAAVGAAI